MTTYQDTVPQDNPATPDSDRHFRFWWDRLCVRDQVTDDPSILKKLTGVGAPALSDEDVARVVDTFSKIGARN